MQCYLYYSFLKDEQDKHIKKIWEQHLEIEIMHLHAAKDLLQKYDNKQWEEVVPAEFPTLLDFKQTKEYVRDILDTQVELTVDREDFVDIAELPQKHEFFQYQNAVHGDVDSVQSHVVIVTYQDQDDDGEDYRYEESDNPVAALADRTEDNTDIGRVANARAEYDSEEQEEDEDDDDIEVDVVDEEVMEYDDDDDDDEEEDEEEDRPASKKKQGRKKMAKSRSR